MACGFGIVQLRASVCGGLHCGGWGVGRPRACVRACRVCQAHGTLACGCVESCRLGTIACEVHRRRICPPPVDKRCARRRPVYIIYNAFIGNPKPSPSPRIFSRILPKPSAYQTLRTVTTLPRTEPWETPQKQA